MKQRLSATRSRLDDESLLRERPCETLEWNARTDIDGGSYWSARFRPRAVAACCIRPAKLARWLQRLLWIATASARHYRPAARGLGSSGVRSATTTLESRSIIGGQRHQRSLARHSSITDGVRGMVVACSCRRSAARADRSSLPRGSSLRLQPVMVASTISRCRCGVAVALGLHLPDHFLPIAQDQRRAMTFHRRRHSLPSSAS